MEPALNYEDFVQQAHSNFQIQLEPPNVVDLELTEVSAVKRSETQEEFAITFRGPLDAFLGQGTRSVAHEKMGEFDVFLVPISKESDGYHYEAIYNYYKSQPQQAAS